LHSQQIALIEQTAVGNILGPMGLSLQRIPSLQIGKALNTDVYPLNFLPIDIRVGDALWLWCTSVALCLVAAVVPARRAMRVPIAQALATQ
jgi:lipoprotein-releasing system permease protein